MNATSKTTASRRRIAVADVRAEDKRFTREEVDSLRDALQAIAEESESGERTGRGRPRDPALYRNVALLVRLAALTGCRIGELLRLRAKDVRAQGEHTRLWIRRQKGGVTGYVKIGNGVAEELHALAREVRGAGLLFTTSNGNALSQQQLSRCMAAGIEHAGIDLGERQTWHALRAHAAWREWERTGDLRRTQALLGHASQASTAVYLQLDERAREEMIEEALEGEHY